MQMLLKAGCHELVLVFSQISAAQAASLFAHQGEGDAAAPCIHVRDYSMLQVRLCLLNEADCKGTRLGAPVPLCLT